MHRAHMETWLANIRSVCRFSDMFRLEAFKKHLTLHYGEKLQMSPTGEKPLWVNVETCPLDVLRTICTAVSLQDSNLLPF